MVIAGYILAVVGCLVFLVGQVMLLKAAYKRGLGWFFGCLFCAPVWLVFLAFDFAAAVKPLGVAVAGLLLAALGGWMAGIEVV
jgi:hypothetical protein